MQNTFVFILCPPYTGSTLLVRILESSSNISLNNHKGTCEGQKLDELKDMYSQGGRWNPTTPLDWNHIKSVWMSKWDLSRKYLLEKSPPNLIRAKTILKHFEKAHFILLIRDPFAICESLKTRNGFEIEQAARTTIKFFKYQYENAINYPESLTITYENLVDNTRNVIKEIQDNLRLIGDLEIKPEYEIHNSVSQDYKGIKNTNASKIARLSQAEQALIRNEFNQSAEYFNFFGYDINL